MRLSDFPVSFGTSGARGLVSGLTPEYCYSFTHALFHILKMAEPILIVGCDLRPSSPRIASHCLAAARSAGIDCLYAGALPTPALALAAQTHRMAAIMVTGSHIPADRNGLKAYRPDGEITKADERAMLAVEVPAPPLADERPLPSGEGRFLDEYAARYLSAFPPDALEGLRIGVYEHSSVARDILHRVLRGLGAETERLGRSEEFLAIDTEAIRPEDRARAKEWSSSGRYDAIVSADGDGDRPMLADEQGGWLSGDIIGLLAARALGIASAVTPLTSNSAIETCGAFHAIIRTRIGSPDVLAGMAASDLMAPVAGFEANGGFLLGSALVFGGRRLEALPTRDAMLPILAVLAHCRNASTPLSALRGTLPARFTHSGRLADFPAEESGTLLSRIAEDDALAIRLMAPHSASIARRDRTDGVRLTFAGGHIVHLRPSGNAPELRCYTEASSPATAEQLCNDCLRNISLARNKHRGFLR